MLGCMRVRANPCQRMATTPASRREGTFVDRVLLLSEGFAQ